jgi:plasmid stabilization system protein ParE
MVKIIITESAREKLKNLKLFYKKEPSRAETIISKIREGYNTLRRFPKAGAIETYLENDRIIYRSLVVDKNYKLIYYIEANVVTIIAIWDCRQDPVKLFDEL